MRILHLIRSESKVQGFKRWLTRVDRYFPGETWIEDCSIDLLTELLRVFWDGGKTAAEAVVILDALRDEIKRRIAAHQRKPFYSGRPIESPN